MHDPKLYRKLTRLQAHPFDYATIYDGSSLELQPHNNHILRSESAEMCPQIGQVKHGLDPCSVVATYTIYYMLKMSLNVLPCGKSTNMAG